jgi:hypothetical protein
VLRTKNVIATDIGLIVIAISQYLILSNIKHTILYEFDIYGVRLTEIGPNMLPQYVH